jgi:hypothetical protein
LLSHVFSFFAHSSSFVEVQSRSPHFLVLVSLQRKKPHDDDETETKSQTAKKAKEEEIEEISAPQVCFSAWWSCF